MPTHKKEAYKRFMVLIKAGLPYTIGGGIVIFLGIYVLKHLFAGHGSTLTLLLFAWLGLFWAVYQPMFRKKIEKVKRNLG